jgi:hypothetical protein
MNAVDRLIENYSRQVRLTWSTNLAGKQRVWFAVYPPSEERRMRARISEFETLTNQAGHEWATVDLTQLLPEWISQHEYREAIFASPEHFAVDRSLEDQAAESIRQACSRDDVGPNTVVAVTGLASLFDLVRISHLVERSEDHIRGRLLVMFPGEYAGNIYRFMNARDGFNYMAVPITSAESFIK